MAINQNDNNQNLFKGRAYSLASEYSDSSTKREYNPVRNNKLAKNNSSNSFSTKQAKELNTYLKNELELRKKSLAELKELVSFSKDEIKYQKFINNYQKASLSDKKDYIKYQVESLKRLQQEDSFHKDILERKKQSGAASEDELKLYDRIISVMKERNDEIEHWQKAQHTIEKELEKALYANVSAQEKRAAIEEKIKNQREQENKIVYLFEKKRSELLDEHTKKHKKAVDEEFQNEKEAIETKLNLEKSAQETMLKEAIRIKQEEKAKLDALKDKGEISNVAYDNELKVIELQFNSIKENVQNQINQSLEEYEKSLTELENKKSKETERRVKESSKKENDEILKQEKEALKKSREKSGIDRFGNLNIFKAFKDDKEKNKGTNNVGSAINGAIGEVLRGGSLSSAFSTAFSSALPSLHAALGPIATILSGIAKVVGKISGQLNKGIENALTDQNTYLGKMNARLQGSGESFVKIQNYLSSNFGTSPFVSQRKTLENIAQLVEKGTTFNVEQRGVLMTLSDKIATTFDALDATLTRMIRVQQTDITGTQLGYEALLTKFLNEQFGDTSYMEVYDSVTSQLLDASSQLSADQATEFNYTVQKWLGSLYSVGMSSEGVQRIAEGINYLATGNVDALNSNDALRTLFASAAGGAYSQMLTGGLNAATVNELLSSIVGYLQSIAGDTNQVTKQALASTFGGFSLTDMRSVMNLTQDNLNTIYAATKSATDARIELSNQLNYATTLYNAADESTNARFAFADIYETGTENILYNFGKKYLSDFSDYRSFYINKMLQESNLPLISDAAKLWEGVKELFSGGFSAVISQLKLYGNDFSDFDADYKAPVKPENFDKMNALLTNTGLGSEYLNWALDQGWRLDGMYQEDINREFLKDKGYSLDDIEAYYAYQTAAAKSKTNQHALFIESDAVKSMWLNAQTRGTASITPSAAAANTLSGFSGMVRMNLGNTAVESGNAIADLGQTVAASAAAGAATAVTSYSSTKDVTALYTELFERQTTAMKVSLSTIDSSAASILTSILNNTKVTAVGINNVGESALKALAETLHTDKLDAIDDKLDSGINVNVNDNYLNTINNGLAYARGI